MAPLSALAYQKSAVSLCSSRKSYTVINTCIGMCEMRAVLIALEGFSRSYTGFKNGQTYHCSRCHQAIVLSIG